MHQNSPRVRITAGLATSCYTQNGLQAKKGHCEQLHASQVQGYQIDYDDWHAKVHGDLPYEELVYPDPKLRKILETLPYPKFIFTNADIAHARKVLGIMGVEDLFEVQFLRTCTQTLKEIQSLRNLRTCQCPSHVTVQDCLPSGGHG